MKSSASKLYTLLSNLLEWSRLQRGMIKPKTELFSLFDVFDECFLVSSDMAKQKQIKIINEVPVGLQVRADKNMVQIVVHNLLTNALKFTPSGGKIDVEASKNDDGFTSVTIRDTGIGMSKKLLNDLFRIDKKTNRPGTNDEPSSGLGLIICKEFVEKNNGKISVESEEGKGTSFTFTLPSAE
ncbi:MAG: HAMP domain-containing histidine kinase [Prolixibacteraceae bacterium]|nr:HAMP domain-containing histidine kinase [Prolixibacteraceae bacterium]